MNRDEFGDLRRQIPAGPAASPADEVPGAQLIGAVIAGTAKKPGPDGETIHGLVMETRSGWFYLWFLNDAEEGYAGYAGIEKVTMDNLKMGTGGEK